eukprot:CAMPEP_0117672064 /NCGR_PEP_ID=MMETSP0804-20121206/13692_1 /TAXON_ID=1074897 /ORGANISM="Tetraselmis astigmatica, Strain CCMP880" /LENGTH=591 /DNA_ID=CAMNT_0005480615 /DNA_START=144 /DNA_END=1919 /DNA_ORIENTATION=+
MPGFGSDSSAPGGISNSGGIGSSSHQSGNYSSGTKYTGFGNPNLPPPTAKPSSFGSYLSPQTWIDGAQEAVNAASQLVSGYQTGGNQQKATPFLREPPDNYQAPAAMSGSPSSSSYRPVAVVHTESVAHQASAPLPSRNGQGADQPAKTAEARLVESMCNAGGVRVHPRVEDLHRFVTSAAGMDIKAVTGLLVAQVEAGTWQAGLRALCCLETLLEGTPSACREAVLQQLGKEGEAIRQATRSPQASVSKRADAVLFLLHPDGPKASRNGIAAPTAAVPNMIDIADDVPAPASGPQANAVDLLGDLMGPEPVATVPTPASMGGLFDGMTVGATPSAQQPPAVSASTTAATAPASQGDPLGSMFQGLTVGSAAQPPQPAPPQPQAASHLPGANGELAELFGGLESDCPSAGGVMVTPQPSQGSSMPLGVMSRAEGMGMVMPPPPSQGGAMGMMGPPPGGQPGMGMAPHPGRGHPGMMMMMPQQQQSMYSQQMGMGVGVPQQHPGMMMMPPQHPYQQQQFWQPGPGTPGMHPLGGIVAAPRPATSGGQAGRSAAPDIFHRTSEGKTATSYTKAFPEKHEPAFDFIGEHLKTSK